MGEIMVIDKNGKIRPKYIRLLNRRRRSRTLPGVNQEKQAVHQLEGLHGEYIDAIDADDVTPYPYPVAPPAVPDVPVRLDGAEGSIYPYEPSGGAPDPDIPYNIGEIGTLLPPRFIEQPWKTANQRLFRAGDTVVWRTTNEIGKINQVIGEEALVFIGRVRYRIPIQELVIYNNEVRAIKQVSDGRDEARLVRKVRRGR